MSIEMEIGRLVNFGLFRKLSITAPFCKQDGLKRSFNNLTPMEKVVIETLLDGGVFKQWHSILLREKEDNDEFSNAEFLLIKVYVQHCCLFYSKIFCKPQEL